MKGKTMDKVIKIGKDKNVVWFEEATNTDHKVVCPLQSAKKEDCCTAKCAGYMNNGDRAICQFMPSGTRVIGIIEGA